MSTVPGSLDDAALRALYQSVILEHNRSPRNRGHVSERTHWARGFNPLCGDDVTVSLRVEGGRAVAVGFEGKGCAICTASASCMTEVCAGETPERLVDVARYFEDLVSGGRAVGAASEGELLWAFAPVARFPSRIKCAILPWRALLQALDGAGDVVTTEDL